MGCKIYYLNFLNIAITLLIRLLTYLVKFPVSIYLCAYIITKSRAKCCCPPVQDSRRIRQYYATPSCHLSPGLPLLVLWICSRGTLFGTACPCILRALPYPCSSCPVFRSRRINRDRVSQVLDVGRRVLDLSDSATRHSGLPVDEYFGVSYSSVLVDLIRQTW